MTAYYNEIDPYAARWLRNLIAAGHIAPGDVDERDIRDIKPNEIRGYTQCHFFAGVGVWSYALRLAGWPDDSPVWTGSCPCQPFSSAGLARGFADERHLWPFFHFLIEECGPGVVFGEQVASKDADTWIDLVQDDLEALGYAFGAVPFPSAGIGAPHLRDRLYWVADSDMQQHEGSARNAKGVEEFRGSGPTHRVADADDTGLEGLGSGHKTEGGRVGEVRPIAPASKSCRVEHATGDGWEQRGTESGRGSIAAGCTPSGLADTFDSTGHGSQPRGTIRELPQGVGALQTECRPTRPTNGFWRDADWLFCRDGKWRPVEAGTSPLAHGAPSRVGRLRAYGNAINVEAAKVFIESYMETRPK